MWANPGKGKIMYQNNGKQVIFVEAGVTTHIADAGDNEKAHSIAYRMNAGRFISDAKRTLSPAWYGDKVDIAEFKGRINGAIDALNKLDQVKKSLFYGRDNNLTSLGRRNLVTFPEDAAPSERLANIIHGIIGKATEAGELLEALRDHYNGQELDRINVIEEIGDGFWYDALLLDQMDADFADAQELNIAKLRARFPDKFEAVQANERDLAGERVILEAGAIIGIDYDDRNPAVDASTQFEPTAPASGPLPVLAAEAKANAAFAAVKAPRNDYTDAMPVNTNSELAKSIGERLNPMPSENLARQPIRKSDVPKK